MIVIQFDVESGTRMSHPYAQMPANVVSDLSPEWRRDLLPGDILRRIYSNGFHPFIVLRRADIHPASVEICPHQNDMEAFTTVLTDWAGHSRFIRGLQHAIKSEPYEAAFAFFDWIFDPEDIGNAYLYDQHEYPFPGYFDYPILEVGGSGPIFAVDKVDLLADVFDAYQKSKGNDRLRFAILEALGFALSRGMGAIGQYTRALEFVGRALSAQPKSFYLPMCLYALEQKINASSVPVRLEKFLNHDLHALDSVVCPLPFTRLEITPDGYAHVCCASLVPYTIGNIEENSIPQIMNSENARKMRASMLDGSYRYCDHVNCPQMIRDKIPKKTDPEILEDPVLGRAVMAGDLEINEIRELTFGYDWSCNLSCPSCRRETIIDHHMQSSERANHIKQNIVPLLSRLRLLYINNAVTAHP